MLVATAKPLSGGWNQGQVLHAREDYSRIGEQAGLVQAAIGREGGAGASKTPTPRTPVAVATHNESRNLLKETYAHLATSAGFPQPAGPQGP